MSTLSQFGSGIKSIQRGTITLTPGAPSTTVTIAAVNTSKTVLNLLGYRCDNGYISLASSTSISATYLNVSGFTNILSYEVVEYY